MYVIYIIKHVYIILFLHRRYACIAIRMSMFVTCYVIFKVRYIFTKIEKKFVEKFHSTSLS